MIGRNERCWCGSGKKYKKCCVNKKPRNSIFEFDFGRQVTINQIKVSSQSGKIDFLKDGQAVVPSKVVSQMAYPRSKGQKVLVEAPSGVQLDISGAFHADQYDAIIAIDTNTQKIAGELISVCGVVAARAIRFPGFLQLERQPVACLEFRNVVGKPENVAWREVIKALRLPLEIKRIALVIDSDLGEIRKYNSREKPIIDNFFLPFNMSFIYASSDSGQDLVFNKPIVEADREARRVLNYVAKHITDKRDLRRVAGKPYSYFRRWNIVSGNVTDPSHINVPRPPC